MPATTQRGNVRSAQQNITISLKRFLLLILAALASLCLINATYALDVQSELSNQKRKLKTRDFKDMPVALVEVRNLQSETWYEDLEIEVRNISSKPIYFVRAYLLFPDEKLSSGESGIRLTWGDPDKLDSRNYADIDAEHVEPGKNFILTLPEMFRKGLKTKQRVRPTITKNLVLEFTKIYFGDGTGFEGSQLID